MKFRKPFVVLILIFSIIGISGCISSYTANQSSNYANTQASSTLSILN